MRDGIRNDRRRREEEVKEKEKKNAHSNAEIKENYAPQRHG